jgi:glycosyltransferase involved in cell wall biosynthesis
MKKRILFNSEYSQSASGYAKLTNELMTRLFKTGKYELAELAGLCSPDDERIDNVPWKIYPTLPADNASREELNEFNSHNQNAQGRWKFNETCLDFLPNILFTFRDAWFEEFSYYFPFREFYNLIWWNPVDGEPLEPDWISSAIEADACFTYTEWGEQVLKEACGNKGNILGAMPLGVNSDVFYPIFNKTGIKQHFGFRPDVLVTGFVCRNQPRKLIAALIEAFTKFLLNANDHIKSKAFLYLHTAWPDLSWNIPQLLKDYGVSGRVLFTYHCRNCGACYPTVYCDIGAVCNKCSQAASGTARSSDGIAEQDLNLLYNFMDCYCQVATNEGLGIPAIEAIACGVPTFVTDYSGTVDIINKAGAIPIKSLKLVREMESTMNRYIAIPDTERLASQLNDLFSLPTDLIRNLGYKQYLKGKEWFSWDRAANILMDYIDNCPVKDWGKQPFRIHKPKLDIPQGLSSEELLFYAFNEIIGRPELFNRYKTLKMNYDLIMGLRGNKPDWYPYNADKMIEEAIADWRFYDTWERKRALKFGVKI